MKYIKKEIAALEKCYCVAPLTVDGHPRLLVAAEKHAPCYLFSQDGELLDTVWEEPGGIMTMVQVPGKDGEFLATHRFYSPNDSKDASIVYVCRDKSGKWTVKYLYHIPFVHRFDIFRKDGVNHLLVCTLKSDHEYKDDWRFPGKVYTAVLPDDLSEQTSETMPELKIAAENFCHNHGFTRYCGSDRQESAIISCDSGVYRFLPPEKGGKWKIIQLSDRASSDAICVDIDEDGIDELFMMSPFHGDTACMMKLTSDGPKFCWKADSAMPFLHAVCCGIIGGKRSIVFGNRENERSLLRLYFDNGFHTEKIDSGFGPANALIFSAGGTDRILAANRETNQVAIYICEPEEE